MTKLRGTLLSLSAFVLLAGMTGSVYAKAPHSSDDQSIALNIMDQDQGWGDSVSNTWSETNMAPGDDLDFAGSFVGLRGSQKGRVSIGCDYDVQNGSSPSGPATADDFAEQLIITKLVYSFSDWQIDCLTGEPAGMSQSQEKSYGYPSEGWRLHDADGDGQITFHDLELAPLIGLPLPNADSIGARMVMSVRFAGTAGNDLQGETFEFTMSYTLGPW